MLGLLACACYCSQLLEYILILFLVMRGGASKCRYLWSPEETVRSSETEVIDSCEPPIIGVGNWIRILHKRNMGSQPLSHLFIPHSQLYYTRVGAHNLMLVKRELYSLSWSSPQSQYVFLFHLMKFCELCPHCVCPCSPFAMYTQYWYKGTRDVSNPVQVTDGVVSSFEPL